MKNKTITTILGIIASVIMAFFSKFFGGVDILFLTLLLLISLDIVCGIIKAIIKKELSSSLCFVGIMKKLLILLMVALANVIDILLKAYNINVDFVRNMTILFYAVNEAISIVENVALFLPVPEKIKKVLEQLKNE